MVNRITQNRIRIDFLTLLLTFPFAAASGLAQASQPNILIITVDDMSCDSVGAFGCELEDTTPNIDHLATQGMRFEYAHVQVGNCFPSRNVMFSGMYPHNTGVEGFYQVRDADYPHLVDVFQEAGYFVAIRGKVTHSTPYQPYHWDANLTILDGEAQDQKNAESYYRSTKRGIELAYEAEKPFCLSINVSDPHKPFYAMSGRGEIVDDSNVPSRIFDADEVPIPGFLFDHPDVRLELAHYYSSVRRADDCVGEILRALDESGLANDTVIMFLSDHGMPLPFAKTALWHHSTRTPWIVVWPDTIEPGSIDSSHMISAVDMLPTLLDIAEIDHVSSMDGRSFHSVLLGEEDGERNWVYKVYNENSGGNRSPMRCVQSMQFGYHFNPWSNGERVFKTATTGTMSYRAMVALSETDSTIAARLNHFKHSTLEEFYDYENDPDALHNLVDDPAYAEIVEEYRSLMAHAMRTSNDPMLAVFQNRSNLDQVSQYVDQVQAESDARRQRQRANRNQSSEIDRSRRLFRLRLPRSAQLGETFVVRILHELPSELGEQLFHVTLKDADGQRIERIVTRATGTGETRVSFVVPESLDSTALQVSTFVGEDYERHLFHRTVGPVEIGQ